MKPRITAKLDPDFLPMEWVLRGYEADVRAGARVPF
jgi:hypothetical protein